jgi:hypothetical protein
MLVVISETWSILIASGTLMASVATLIVTSVLGNIRQRRKIEAQREGRLFTERASAYARFNELGVQFSRELKLVSRKGGAPNDTMMDLHRQIDGAQSRMAILSGSFPIQSLSTEVNEMIEDVVLGITPVSEQARVVIDKTSAKFVKSANDELLGISRAESSPRTGDPLVEIGERDE